MLLPSNSGISAVSWPWTSRKNPAMRAVPTLYCSLADSREGARLPQTGSLLFDQSSEAGAVATPGVHSVLKKLWSVPMTIWTDRKAVSPGTA